MAEKTVMDEVNAALGETMGEAPAEEVQEEIAEAVEVESEAVEGEEAGEPEEGTEEAEVEADATADKGPNGERERNPDGTWKKSSAPKLDAEGKPLAAPKKADPINDPIPQGLKKDTQERIRTLIDTTKSVTAERDEIRQNFDYMVNGVQATGATPEQYGETLSWLALFNSRDPAQQERALEIADSVVERLSLLLGKARNVSDPMEQHRDLQDAVAKGQITADYAKEIARTRNGQQFRTQLSSSASQEQQRTQQMAQDRDQARHGLSALETTLRNSDPQYEAKKAILVPALKPVFAALPPSQWVQKFQEAYRALNIAPPAAARPGGVPANQPLRAKSVAGGATKAPSNMLEAINGALSGMRK